MHSTRWLAGACVVIVARVAAAGTTEWTNPIGSVWSDPSNWSNGVPASADTAVFPPLDQDGYVIQVDRQSSCATMLVTGINVTCEGSGPLAITSSLRVGADGTQGSLLVRSLDLTSGTVAI